MCEASVFVIDGKQEKLVMKAVDILKVEEEGSLSLVDIFGEKKSLKGSVKALSLVEHKILIEEEN
ncbi:MAG TPA: CooT family nickel-binding protein [Desulfobacterales bacterium]|nr:CooT family nickel-binding protein [Desulfobacterales bacterium]